MMPGPHVRPERRPSATLQTRGTTHVESQFASARHREMTRQVRDRWLWTNATIVLLGRGGSRKGGIHGARSGLRDAD